MAIRQETIKMKFRIALNWRLDVLGITPIPSWKGTIGEDEWEVRLIPGNMNPNKLDRNLSLDFRCLRNNGSNLWKYETEVNSALKVLGVRSDRSFSATLDYKTKAFVMRWLFECRYYTSVFHIDRSCVRTEDAFLQIKLKVKTVGPARFETPELSLLMKTESLSNVEFVFDDFVKLYANKEMLCASSIVFKNIFDRASDEETREPITVKNTNSAVFHCFLKLLYPACHQFIPNGLIEEVLKLGRQYHVPFVVKACERAFMHNPIETRDFMQNLLIADKYNLNYLNAFCFAEMSPEEIYRVNHHPDKNKLTEQTRKRLFELLRAQDEKGEVCCFCQGKTYVEGAKWEPHDDELHTIYQFRH